MLNRYKINNTEYFARPSTLNEMSKRQMQRNLEEARKAEDNRRRFSPSIDGTYTPKNKSV